MDVLHNRIDGGLLNRKSNNPTRTCGHNTVGGNKDDQCRML